MALEFPENKATAARYVKQAIPMMVKHNIVPNPCNFALWYSYVSNRDAELKVALDETVASQGTCPADITARLFKQHVIKEEMSAQQSLQDSLTNIMQDLTGDVENTRLSADDLTENLESSLTTLANTDDPEQILGAVEKLITSTKATSKVVSNFQQQLSAAELEINALKLQLEEKELDAYLDALTQLGNRRAFDKRLYALCEDEEKAATLILIDLDHFKNLNDSYGHVLGDKVLQGVAQILIELCPQGELAARYGGEEFAILLDGNGTGEQLAETIRLQLKKLSLRKKNSDQLIDNITASFGVAEKLPGEYPEQLIERADQALYAAKEGGRDRVEHAA